MIISAIARILLVWAHEWYRGYLLIPRLLELLIPEIMSIVTELLAQDKRVIADQMSL